MWELDHKEGWAPKDWCFWTVVLEKTLESPLDSKEIQLVLPKGNQSWIFIGRTDAEGETLILWQTWCKELTHWKRLWRWERLKAGEGDDRGWDGWMASLTWWTWVWVNSRGWWWTGRPGVLQFMGLQRIRHDWVDLIPGLKRSPGGGHGNLLQYSCLENPMKKGSCQATAHRVTKSQRWLKQFSMHARKSINLRINLASKSCNYHRNLYS